MNEMLEILKYTIPAIVVFFTVFVMLRSNMKQEWQRLTMQLNKDNQEVTLPLKLQAYERLILFLERISLESVLLRTDHAKMTAGQLQQEIVRNIRMEFDHNLSQQIYVSNEAWQKVLAAKSDTTKFVYLMTKKTGEKGPASRLSQKMLEEMMDNQNSPTRVAINYLKNEARKLV